MGTQQCKKTLEARGLIFLIVGSKTIYDGTMHNKAEQSPQMINNYTALRVRIWTLGTQRINSQFHRSAAVTNTE